jgi:hypothetical protein
VLTSIDVINEINGEAEFVKTVSTDRNGLDIIGAS